MTFVQGGTSGASSLTSVTGPASLVGGEEYLVSPNKAKIAFTSIVFRGPPGPEGSPTLLTSELTNCNVTYDRSLPSASTLLDCPLTMPVGVEVHELAVYFDKNLELLINDTTAGIYSDPAIPSKYSATPPAGGAAFVAYTITIGDGTSRATPIRFVPPITLGEDASIFVTTDMVQTFQLMVDPGGTTLTAHPGNDPVAMAGGFTRGTSHFYSNANAIDSYRIGSVNDFHSLRIFYDSASSPVYLFSPNTCGPDGPKDAYRNPGRLGTDASKTLAWAQSGNDTSFNAYYVMAERSVIGQATDLKCLETATPPEPADSMTYASGAPPMPSPTKSISLTLLAK